MRKIHQVVLVLIAIVLCYIGSCAPRTTLPMRTNGVWHNSSGQLVHWTENRFPLQVMMDDSISLVDFVHLNIAMERWNTQVGHQVFEFVRSDTADVLVTRADIPDREPGVQFQGLARLSEFGGEAINCRIWIDTDTTINETSVVLIHELGHCLGLTHDGWPGSIMYAHAVESGYVLMADDIEFVRWQIAGQSSLLGTH